MRHSGILLPAATWAAVLGAIEGARAGGGSHRAAAIAAGAGCGFVLGLVLGALEVGALRAGGVIDRRTKLGAWWTCRTSPDPAVPRGPVIDFLASIAAALGAFSTFVVGFAVMLPRLASVEEATLRLQLTVALAAVAAVVGAVDGLITFLVARPILRRLDARRPLPWPHPGWARFALWVAVPLGSVCALAVLAAPRSLVAFAVLPAAVLVAVLQIATAPLVARARLDQRRLVPVVGVALLTAAVVAAHRGLATTTVAERMEATVIPRLGASGLRAVTDVDRDRASSLFGGRDCAALDGARHPLARDVPGNGVDEDCSGSDADPSDAAVDLAVTPRGAIDASGVYPTRRNLVWVIVDAVRADATSLLGHKRPTTPFLESLAPDALVFENAYSQSSATMLSIPSMLAGRDPASIAWEHDGERLQLGSAHRTIAERLPRGYRSAIVVDGYLANKLSGLTQGFQDTLSIWLDGKRDPWQDRSSMVAVTRAIDWLERDDALGEKGGKPFALVVYMHNPHAPYDSRPEYGADFGDKPRQRYEAEIAFADRATGFLVDYLRYREVWKNTVFVYNSDHGEEFDEHDGKNHARTCHGESTRVPLLIKIPRVKGARVKGRVAMVDVLPTLLDTLGEDDRAELDGQSLLVPAFEPSAVPEDRPVFCSVISQKESQGLFLRRSVRVGSRALFTDAVSGSEALYDTADDAGEKVDIKDRPDEAETRARLRGTLQRSMRGNLGEAPLSR